VLVAAGCGKAVGRIAAEIETDERRNESLSVRRRRSSHGATMIAVSFAVIAFAAHDREGVAVERHRPTTVGSAPKRVRHNSSPMTATAEASGPAQSSARKTRPRIG